MQSDAITTSESVKKKKKQKKKTSRNKKKKRGVKMKRVNGTRQKDKFRRISYGGWTVGGSGFPL